MLFRSYLIFFSAFTVVVAKDLYVASALSSSFTAQETFSSFQQREERIIPLFLPSLKGYLFVPRP